MSQRYGCVIPAYPVFSARKKTADYNRQDTTVDSTAISCRSLASSCMECSKAIYAAGLHAGNTAGRMLGKLSVSSINLEKIRFNCTLNLGFLFGIQILIEGKQRFDITLSLLSIFKINCYCLKEFGISFETNFADLLQMDISISV